MENESIFSDKIKVKVRSTGKLLDAKVNLTNTKSASVILDNPEYGVSPGQACVFYKSDENGERCLGGGWIK